MPFRHKILRIWMIYALWAQSFVFQISHYFCNFLHNPQNVSATHASNQADACRNWPMSSSDSQNDERLGKKLDETGRLRPVIKFHVSSL